MAWLVKADGQILADQKKQIAWHGSEMLMAMVDTLLRRKKIKQSALCRILVVRGPGPFTAVRTGLIVANTVGYLLNIAVAGVVTTKPLSVSRIRQLVRRLPAKPGIIVRPWYGRQPNITRPASRRAQATGGRKPKR